MCDVRRTSYWTHINEPGATPIRVSTLTKNTNKINNTKNSNYTNNANNSNKAEASKAELSKAKQRQASPEGARGLPRAPEGPLGKA